MNGNETLEATIKAGYKAKVAELKKPQITGPTRPKPPSAPPPVFRQSTRPTSRPPLPLVPPKPSVLETMPLPALPSMAKSNRQRTEQTPPALPPKKTKQSKKPIDMKEPKKADPKYGAIMLQQLCEAMLPLLPNPIARPKLQEHHYFNTKRLIQALQKDNSSAALSTILPTHQRIIGLLSKFACNLLITYINTGIIPEAKDKESTQTQLAFYVRQIIHNQKMDALDTNHAANIFLAAIKLAAHAEPDIQARVFDVCAELQKTGFSIAKIHLNQKKPDKYLLAKLAAIDTSGKLTRELGAIQDDFLFQINKGQLWWCALFEAAAADSKPATFAIAQRCTNYRTLEDFIMRLDDFEVNPKKPEFIMAYRKKYALSHHKMLSMKLLLWDIAFKLYPKEAALPAEIETYHQKAAIHEAKNIKTLSDATAVYKKHIKQPYMTEEKPQQHRMFSPSSSFKRSFIEMMQAEAAKLASAKPEDMSALAWYTSICELMNSALFQEPDERLGLNPLSLKQLESYQAVAGKQVATSKAVI